MFALFDRTRERAICNIQTLLVFMMYSSLEKKGYKYYLFFQKYAESRITLFFSSLLGDQMGHKMTAPGWDAVGSSEN